VQKKVQPCALKWTRVLASAQAWRAPRILCGFPGCVGAGPGGWLLTAQIRPHHTRCCFSQYKRDVKSDYLWLQAALFQKFCSVQRVRGAISILSPRPFEYFIETFLSGFVFVSSSPNFSLKTLKI
jgi:hypothetical protein